MAPVNYRRFVRSTESDQWLDELTTVDSLAQKLLVHLEACSAEIDRAHVYGAPSGAIQLIASRLLKEQLQFSEEVVLKNEIGLSTRARPDFVYRLGARRGILAEVERGGTTTNNHDLKDFWKAHLAREAQHLFLMVPNSNWKEDGGPREKPFPLVVHRLSAFFGDRRREVDVLSAHVFGYGKSLGGSLSTSADRETELADE